MGVGGRCHNPTALPPLPPGKEPVPIVQKAGWAPGLVWMGAENLNPPHPKWDYDWEIYTLISSICVEVMYRKGQC